MFSFIAVRLRLLASHKTVTKTLTFCSPSTMNFIISIHLIFLPYLKNLGPTSHNKTLPNSSFPRAFPISRAGKGVVGGGGGKGVEERLFTVLLVPTVLSMAALLPQPQTLSFLIPGRPASCQIHAGCPLKKKIPDTSFPARVFCRPNGGSR